MKTSVLAIPLVLTLTLAEAPTTCPEVGEFAALVAAQRVRFVPEEEAGEVKGASQAGQDTLRAIKRMIYKSELSPSSAQFFAWRMCEDTAAEPKK